MLPQADDLFYFLEVVNTLNISRAAERIGITQPSLSLAIQRLEHNVGAPLLIRSRTGVKLTKTGHRIAGQARALLSEWERMRAEALREQDQVVGRFSIGCHASVALYGVVGALPGLMRNYPGLEISLVHGLSREITEEVISFKLDIGLVINPVMHPELVIKQIGQDQVSLWVSCDKSPLQDPFSGQGVLAYDPDLAQSQYLLRKFAKIGMTFARTITTSSLEVLTAIVASGAAAGILPGRVASHVKANKLKLFRQDVPHYLDKICLIYRSDNMTNMAGKAIIAGITKDFG